MSTPMISLDGFTLIGRVSSCRLTCQSVRAGDAAEHGWLTPAGDLSEDRAEAVTLTLDLDGLDAGEVARAAREFAEHFGVIDHQQGDAYYWHTDCAPCQCTEFPGCGWEAVGESGAVHWVLFAEGGAELEVDPESIAGEVAEFLAHA